MASETPQTRRGGRIAILIRIAAPVLDLVLAVGDRVSRVLEPDDPAYAPARLPGASDGGSAPRGLPPRPRG